MLRLPIFRYFYLPWAAGLCLILAVLLVQWKSDAIDKIVAVVALPEAEATFTSPRFPGCEDTLYKGRCTKQHLQDYLYNNTTYPASPDNKGTAGLAVVHIRISPLGLIEDIQILRDPGHGRGADAIRSRKKMQQENIRWNPATINDQPVSFPIFLKIRYSNFVWAR